MAQHRIIRLSLCYKDESFVFSGIDEVNIALEQGWQLTTVLQGELLLSMIDHQPETAEGYKLAGWAIPLQMVRMEPSN